MGGIKVGANLSIDGSGILSGSAPYTLPVATPTILGGVKEGSNVTIDGTGIISVAAPYSLPIASASVLGGVKQGSNVTIDGSGVISVASPYSLPIASASVLGGVKVGTNLSIDGSGVLSASGGGGGSSSPSDWKLLDVVTVGVGGASEIDFNAIDQSYYDLELHLSGLGNWADGFFQIRLQFNGDTGNNYDYLITYTHDAGLGNFFNYSGTSSPTMDIGEMNGNDSGNRVSNLNATIYDYTGTILTKSASGIWRLKQSTGVNEIVGSFGGGWNSTAAITSIKILAPGGQNFLHGTSAKIYGVGLLSGSSALTDSITFVINGGGSAITTGIVGDLVVPFACTIDQATMLADQSTTTIVDIWKRDYASFPPTVTQKITASAPPTITSTIKSQDSTLTGWTTAVSAGDILRFNVDSNDNAELLTVSLRVTRS